MAVAEVAGGALSPARAVGLRRVPECSATSALCATGIAGAQVTEGVATGRAWSEYPCEPQGEELPGGTFRLVAPQRSRHTDRDLIQALSTRDLPGIRP